MPLDNETIGELLKIVRGSYDDKEDAFRRFCPDFAGDVTIPITLVLGYLTSCDRDPRFALSTDARKVAGRYVLASSLGKYFTLAEDKMAIIPSPNLTSEVVQRIIDVVDRNATYLE